jgi:phospholipid-binding lipoprotein MlaA
MRTSTVVAPDRRERSGVLTFRIGVRLLFAAAFFAIAPAWAGETDFAGAMAGDSLVDEWYGEEPEEVVSDPLETVNRATLRFNQGLDRWVLTPVTSVYRFIVPTPARRAVLRVFDNLNAPAVTINDLLQREWKDAGVTVARFALNTTVGLAGLFDPAKGIGLEGHESDFGQTLALAGVPAGPFIMLPFVGPTTTRDGAGYVVDFFFRPTTWLLPFADQIVYASIHEGSLGLATLEAQSFGLQMLEESSIDFYAALRSAYLQRRTAEIWARREHHREVVVVDAGAPVPEALIADAAAARSRIPAAGR